MSPSVLIVGAGPAGTAAAITASRLGASVTVIDKATFPRDKCCGDGLTTGALRLLEELDFDPTSVADWQTCSGATLRSPSGRQFAVPLPLGQGQFIAIAPRMQLDHALLQHARSIGVTAHEGVGLKKIVRNDPSGVIVMTTDDELLQADYLIAADGMWSPTRKELGLSLDDYRGEWHAFRQYASNVTGEAAHKLFVWFEKDLLPGYAWSFPLPDNRVNFGFGMLRTRTNGKNDSVQFMNDIWKELPRRPHIAEALGSSVQFDGRHTAWPIPARITDVVHSSGRALLVGDAVCASDTLTGEGIGQALLTGMLAARAITQGKDPVHVAMLYDRFLKREFRADHKMSALLGKILATTVGARGALRIVDTSQWARSNFARWMFEDEPRAIAFTPRRWHRRFLSRPGAFVD